MLLIVLACGVLTLAAGWWIFSATPDDAAPSMRQVRRQALVERKAAIYENLRDLHFEHLAGKLSPADYERTRRMLEGEAARVVTALDQS